MNDLVAMRVRGWACSGSHEGLARALLGPTASRREALWNPGAWRVEDPLPPHDPVGPIRSVIVFETSGRADVEIAPGSQGLDHPPEAAGHAIVRPDVTPEQSLLLDARCWYRVLEGTELRCVLWMYSVLAETDG